MADATSKNTPPVDAEIADKLPAAPETAQELTETAAKDAPADDEAQVAGASKESDNAGAKADQTAEKADADASPSQDAQTNGAEVSTPANKKTKRKSVSGPSTTKKLNRKKSMPDLHLNVQPGEYWYVQMKGYPPWPAIICDEEMLPPSLLSKRPVSAMRVDGTYREDFEEGGKNARDRRYPVMFLGTNEFAWQVNTELSRLDLDELKGKVERNEQGKKTKSLWQAYEIAAENNELSYFKNMLDEHEQHLIQERERAEEVEAKKQAKKEKKAKSKSEVDSDIDMEDADEPSEKKKPTKKRKKSEAEVDEAGSKKTKIVLKGLKSTGDEDQPSKPKKARKSKAADSEEEEKAADSQLSPAEQLKKREKTIYYLRHRLQKGLVSRTNEPQPEEMATMEHHLSVLEQYQDLEPEIIRDTKVNKLLKVILKLATIPRDEEFKFKERCQKLLAAWTEILHAAETTEKPTTASTTNGTANGKVEPESDAKAQENKVEDGKAEPSTDAPVSNGKSEDDSEEKAEADASSAVADAKPATTEVSAEA